MKKPGVLPSPAGPKPRRFFARPAKLISVVSCTANTRRPMHCLAVRAAAVSTIPVTETCGDDKKPCIAISPGSRLADPPQHQRSLRRDPLDHPVRTLRDPNIPKSHCKSPGQITPNVLNQILQFQWNHFHASRSPCGEGLGVGVVVGGRDSAQQLRPPPRPPPLRFGGRPSPQGGGWAGARAIMPGDRVRGTGRPAQRNTL